MATTSPMIILSGPIEKRKDEIVRILLIEDDRSVREALERDLKESGCLVVAVDSPEAALLNPIEDFHCVIADVQFNGSRMSGDDFILQHGQRLRGAKKVVITGHGRDQVKSLDTLRGMGIEVLEKGEQTPEQLVATVNEVLEQRTRMLRERIDQALKEEVSPNPKHPADKLVERAKKIVVEWLEQAEEPDKEGLFYGGKAYSPRAMISEIDRGTDVGAAHIDMMLNLIEHKIGLKK